MTADKRQEGYTLLELVFASGMTLLLILPAMAMLYRSAELVDNVESRFLMNAQARQIMRSLWDGGTDLGGPGTDGTNYVYGIRGSDVMPTGTLRQGYNFYLESNGLNLSGDVFSSINVQCTTTAAPLPDCTDNTDIENVTGWLIDDVTMEGDARSVADRTIETSFIVGDALQMNKSVSLSPQAREAFRTIVTLNPEGMGTPPGFFGGGGAAMFGGGGG